MSKIHIISKTQKFDCRTLVVVQSFRPTLEAWICTDWTYDRVARKAFDLKNLCLKQSHFTVSKYDKEDRMEHIYETVIPEILSRQERCNSLMICVKPERILLNRELG